MTWSLKKKNDPIEEVLGRDGYLWQTAPKSARTTPRRNIVTGIIDLKSSGVKADAPLKSFQLFFDDTMITKIVTCTNQENENVRKVYKSRSGFVYDTNETEVRACLRILLFLA